MGVIKGALKEELVNSLRMKKAYEKELSNIPRGTIIKKKIKGHEYCYLLTREKGKVKQTYMGKLSAQEIDKYKRAKAYRAKYRQLLAKVKKQIRFLEGTLRGKESI
jgi:hypothetical protein